MIFSENFFSIAFTHFWKQKMRKTIIFMHFREKEEAENQRPYLVRYEITVRPHNWVG